MRAQRRPEIFYDPARCQFYQRRLTSQPGAQAFIAYDFIISLSPELIGVKQGAAHAISPAAALGPTSGIHQHDDANPYHDRITRGLGGDGPVLQLGTDAPRLEKQSFSPQRRNFVCIGSIDGRKNQTMVVEAFKALWKRGVDAPLVLIGDAFTHVELSNIKDIGPDPRFRWVRHASDDAIRAALRHARATIYLSATEGYGLPPVESLHAGIPVIVSANIPSIQALPPMGNGGSIRSMATRSKPQFLPSPMFQRLPASGPKQGP